MKNTPLSMIVVLSCVCLVVSAILGFANYLTKDKIAEIAEQKIQNAMLEIIPDSQFNSVEISNDSELDALYEAKSSDGSLKGVCAQITVTGSVSDITLIVGVSSDNKISGVKITSINETAGLGSKANDANWLKQFEGHTGPLNLAKNKAETESDIIAISGATETSRAVTNAVQTALDCANDYLGGVTK